MHRFSLHLFLIIIGFTLACKGAETVNTGPAPQWVIEVEPGTLKEAQSGDGSVRYLLSDTQRHLEEKTYYNAITTEILTAAGAEEYSQLSVDFQPSYQTLVWHSLKVERDGEIQDRLQAAQFEVIQREKGLDRQLYDGELTAHVILKDIRPGDLVSYSYSVSGENPIFAGHQHSFSQLAYGVEVGRVNRRIIWDETKRTLNWQLDGGDLPIAEEKLADGLRCLVYANSPVEKWDAEDGTPSWFTDFPFLEVSDYQSWEEFGAWAFEIYSKQDPLPPAFKKICDEIRAKELPPEQEIIEALRWVQGNIRYLGSFLGEHTHAPHPIAEIDHRRFGDCKDKGMTTVSMLRYLGHDAAPALVNTYSYGTVAESLPGHANFDHLIVHLKHQDKDYWLDPTRTFQRGTLDSQYSPNYGRSFVVREGSDELHQVEPSGFDEATVDVREVFSLKDEAGNGSFTVTTIFSGIKADATRRTLASESRSELEEGYRDYYERDYPGLEVASPLEIIDDQEQNRVTTIEHYTLTDFIEQPETEGGAASGSVYARLIGGYIDIPDSKKRKHPYQISHPVRYSQTIELTVPKAWEMEPERFSFNLPSASYSYKSSTYGRRLVIKHQYDSHTDHVAPEDFVAYTKAMKEADDTLYFGYNFPLDDGIEETAAVTDEKSFTKSRVLLGFFVILGLVTGLVISTALYFWNPPARESLQGSPQGIGGWMILPMIGCIVYPFVSMFVVGSFFGNIGEGNVDLFNGSDDQLMWRLYYCIGVFSESMIFSLAVLQFVLLVKCRTSFPYVYIGLGLLGLGDLILNYGLQSMVNVSDESGTLAGEIGGSVARLAVWGSYMILSERVKATFVRRRGKKSVAGPPPIPVMASHSYQEELQPPAQ